MADPNLSYDVVDVFARTPFAGNQLAVVHGTDGLSDEALLALAQEFNFSETTFPTPVDGGRYRVRIFTPAGEIPFAGHPTLGTAWVLRERGLLGGDIVVQECVAGEVRVRFADEMVQLEVAPRELHGPLDDSAVVPLLASLGLGPADLAGEVWAAGTGLTFVHLPVHDAAVARAGLIGGPQPALPQGTDVVGGLNLYAVRGAGVDGLDVHSRVFVPELAVPEDPATGSAAAGLGLALHARGLLAADGRYRISQGSEMGRPSDLRGAVTVVAGAVEVVRVAGEVHPIARGEIRIP